MTPMPWGKPQEVTTNVRSPCEVKEIEILQKMESVQCQQDHTALSRSHTLAHNSLTRPGSVEQSHIGPSSHLDGMGHNIHLPH